MILSRDAIAVAAFAASTILTLPAFAAAPVELEARPVGKVAVETGVPTDYKLDKEMVVRNWVLCISRTFAEQLADARRVSPDAALATYNDLKSAKSCGRFSHMRVILREPVYGGIAGSVGGDATVFEADVDLAGNWASAYVVSGSLPNQ